MAPDRYPSVPPECRAVRRQLGAESDEAAAHIAAHLAGCEFCRAEAHRLGAAWALLNIVEPRRPSSQFAQGVWAKIAESSRGSGHGWGGLPAWSVRGVAAAAAVILLSVVPVAVWHQSSRDEPERLAQADVMDSRELLTNLDVVEELDVLLLLDDP